MDSAGFRFVCADGCFDFDLTVDLVTAYLASSALIENVRVVPNMAQHKGRTKPHLWEKEIALLIQQSLLYISGGEVSDDVLFEAKYHLQKPSFRTPFYLRQYGGKSLLDQIVVEFSPKDDLFERRAGLNISVRDLEGANLRSKIAENLLVSGFSPVGVLDNGFTAYTDGKSGLEVFIHQTEEAATVSIRKS